MRDLLGDDLGAGILGFVRHMEEVRDAFSEIREAWAEVGAEWEHMHDRPGAIAAMPCLKLLDTALLPLPENTVIGLLSQAMPAGSRRVPQMAAEGYISVCTQGLPI